MYAVSWGWVKRQISNANAIGPDVAGEWFLCDPVWSGPVLSGPVLSGLVLSGPSCDEVGSDQGSQAGLQTSIVIDSTRKTTSTGGMSPTNNEGSNERGRLNPVKFIPPLFE